MRALVEENPSAHESIAKAGSPANLVELLKNGIPDAKDYALWSLSLSIAADNQATVAEAGGVQPLIDQLADARTVIQEQAAAAIAKLAHDNDETRAAITRLGGVKPLIRLLGLDKVDLMLLHWPCQTMAQTIATYRALEDFQLAGKATNIGISNFNSTAIKALYAAGLRVPPVVNQCGFSIAGHSRPDAGRDGGSGAPSAPPS